MTSLSREGVVADGSGAQGRKDEWECIDLECGHYDGDMCLCGGMDCPPEQDVCEECQ